MIKKIIAAILSLVMLTVVFTACGNSKTAVGSGSPSASQSAQTNTPKELKKFNVGYLPSTGHILYFIAQEKGYFKEEGLDTELFQFNNSGEGINAILAGKLDAGSFGTAPPLTFITKGNDLTIFGGQMAEGHAIITKPENAETFKDIKNFKGKTIATVRLATGDIVFRGGFTEAGIDWKKDMTINELESPAAVLEAVKKGSVDAGIVWTPFRKMAEDQGLVVVQYSGDVHGMSNHPCCRQVALTEKLKANPSDYEHFLAALIKAYKFYKTNQAESIDILSKYVKVDKAILEKETYGGHIASNPDPNREGVEKFWEFMNKIGYIKSDINIGDHINTTLYKNALDSVLQQYPDDEIFKQLKADFKE
ncbi:MAG: ABC transporter substrate-binding protein [Clostridia bacterium]|nr:ABC transporter substrate-binding protein [Clostridia bacterium]